MERRKTCSEKIKKLEKRVKKLEECEIEMVSRFVGGIWEIVASVPLLVIGAKVFEIALTSAVKGLLAWIGLFVVLAVAGFLLGTGGALLIMGLKNLWRSFEIWLDI